MTAMKVYWKQDKRDWFHGEPVDSLEWGRQLKREYEAKGCKALVLIDGGKQEDKNEAGKSSIS